MPTNPYEPPNEPTEPIPPGRHPSLKSVVVLTGWGLAAIPAAFICGGITCYSVGVTGELLAKAGGYEQNDTWREMGWLVGIPIALLVTTLLIVAAICTLYERVDRPQG